MKKFLPVLLIILFSGCSASNQVTKLDKVSSSFISYPSGKVLEHQIVVDTSKKEVWENYTTSSGLQTFLAPVVKVDFRVGGVLESSPDLSARIGDSNNVKNEIIAFVPEHSLAMKVIEVPAQVPHPDLVKKLWTQIEIISLNEEQTLVKGRMMGWGDGKEWDELKLFFTQVNEFTFNQLKYALEIGPTDWKSLASNQTQ